MIQNFRIVRCARLLALPVAVVVIPALLPTQIFSQIVDSDAFNGAADHSILELADSPTGHATGITESFTNPNPYAPLEGQQSNALRLDPQPLTKIASTDAAYDAPLAPRPKLRGSTPQSTHADQFGGDTSGTFATNVEKTGPSPTSNSRFINAGDTNRLRGTGLHPIPERAEQHQRRLQSNVQTIGGSVGSFRSSADPRSDQYTGSGVGPTETAGLNSNVRVDDSAYGSGEGSEEPEYESAYLHDQIAQGDQPAKDFSSSPLNSRRLAPAPQQTIGGTADQTDRGRGVEQTAFVSPAVAVQSQSFQNGQFNQSSPQRSTIPQNQPGGFGNQPQHRQQTNQQKLPRQNDSQTEVASSSSETAKQVIAKFAFDANQQSVDGLPIRLLDLLRQSQGRADRSGVIPQYWEVYYDWAQSISAAHHRDWVSSIDSAKQTDAGSLEIAKSNAQNAITFSSIQISKSQAKMNAFTGGNQPIVPLDSPTVTRVKTNYAAFKQRGMISSKYEGIDATLKQMHELIVSRANTVAMAEKNANEAKQLYSRNQSTVDHVLSAGRTWRAAESDFIASVVEYNKAYADYALALPYGRGPVETVVKMLIVQPTASQGKTNGQVASGRPNFSNNTGVTSGGSDHSIPYRGASASNSRGSATAASNAIRSQPVANSFGRQSATASNSSFNNRQRSTGGINLAPQQIQPNSPTGSASNGGPANPGTNLIRRPSQFPTSQSNQSKGNQFSFPGGQNGNAQPPNQRSFNDQRQDSQNVGENKTANRPGPFSSIRSADRSTAVPANTPKPPANSGFNFGG